MSKWFKRTKLGSTTYTNYLGGIKPTTFSQSYTDGSTRRTYTNRGGKITLTTTTKQGGYRKVERKILNKKQKNIKYKPLKYSRVKWKKPIRAKKIRAYRHSESNNISFKILFYMLLFSLLPMALKIL